MQADPEFSTIFPWANTTSSTTNAAALQFAQSIQSHPAIPFGIRGENTRNQAILSIIDSATYLIPPLCQFHANDVRHLDRLLPAGDTFDLIVIDPPWWNRYVRRAKRAKPEAGYELLDADAIASIPLPNRLHADSLVAIWCTNAPSHVRFVHDVLLPGWGLELVSQWFWVKVTQRGQAVCEFRDVLQKQPFERLFVARTRRPTEGIDCRFEELKKIRFLFTVPSAVHSHKPPVIGEC